jgi:sulfate permease, SulP family
VAFVVYTHNLTIGVLVGVLLSGVFFAWKIAQIFEIRSEIGADGSMRVYHVRGQLFFASAEQFMAAFDFDEKVSRVVIDLTHAHIWDISSVASIDKAVLKFRKAGVDVSLSGMNEASETIVDTLGVHHKENGDLLVGH